MSARQFSSAASASIVSDIATTPPGAVPARYRAAEATVIFWTCQNVEFGGSSVGKVFPSKRGKLPRVPQNYFYEGSGWEPVGAPEFPHRTGPLSAALYLPAGRQPRAAKFCSEPQ